MVFELQLALFHALQLQHVDCRRLIQQCNRRIQVAMLLGQLRQFGARGDFIVADNAALSSNVVAIGSTDAIATASLTAGALNAVRINPQVASLGKRYLGARYTVVGTNTAGTVTADIVNTIQDGKKFYASGFTVA